MSTAKKPFHEVVAERLIEQLKAGTAPWQKPWEPGEPNAYLPMNPTTGNRYKGINAIHLMAQGRGDSRWLTYRQASAVGAQVRKGEKGTSVQYWKFHEEQTKRDEQGKPVLDEHGKPEKIQVRLERPRVFFATVFNAEQIDGLPPQQHQEKPEQQWNAVERAEHILAASGARIRHVEGDRAFYRPSTDSITMPEKGQFDSADKYYATALHELGHWTGHPSRLDRDLAHPFGSEGYAKEELRAEISSMILGDELGIGHDPGQHAAYVGSWVKVLQDDPMEIFRAAADAEKIHGFVMAFEQKQVVEQKNEHEIQAVHDSLLAKLEEWSQNANEGYNSLESWQNLEAVAKSNGLDAYMVEPTDDQLGDAVVRYRKDGEDLPIITELAGGDGKAVTSFNGARVPGTGLTSDLEWQANALNYAVREVIQVQEATLSQDVAGSERVVNDAAEQWVVNQLQQDTFNNSFEGATLQQVEKAQAVLDSMSPLNNQNEFWQRNDLPLSGDEEQQLYQLEQLDERIRKGIGFLDERKEQLILAAKEGQLEAAAADLLAETENKSAVIAVRERTLIDVPFREKDEAKALGARWDRQEKSWYVPGGVDLAQFSKWTAGSESREVQEQGQQAAQAVSQVKAGGDQERVYLAVPYGEREVAKAAGAKWDRVAKSWYAGENADMEKLERWKPENVQSDQGPAMSPQEEFADALRSVGCVVDGAHPIMDGKPHRISVEGDKKGERAGFYVGHLDGHPAGFIKNNRTGIDMKWKSKGYSLDPAEKAKLQAEAAAKLAARAEEQERLQEATSQRVTRHASELEQVTEPTAYIRSKGVQVQKGVLTDKEGEKTYIPAVDADGKQWSMQYIQEDGTKRFAKDSRKEGCFHPVGGMEAVAAAPALIIAEGYATAASVAEAAGQPVIAAFDSGNLESVAKALHAKFPDKPVIVAGDDDRHLELTQGVNPGRSKATEAAAAVGGKAIFPVFAPGENSYPDSLPPITPQVFRDHEKALRKLDAEEAGKVQLSEKEVAELKKTLLSDEQLAALGNMKGKTDFNDLATKSSLGKEGVQRQVTAAVTKIVQDEERRVEQKQEQKQEQKLEKRPRRAAKVG